MEKQVKRSLPVQLTEKERLEKSLELTLLMEEATGIERAKKRSADEFKEKLDTINGSISRVHAVVHSGKEFRMIDCVWTFSFTRMEKTLIRTDTGEKVVTEALTDSERQLVLNADINADHPEAEAKPEEKAS